MTAASPARAATRPIRWNWRNLGILVRCFGYLMPYGRVVASAYLVVLVINGLNVAIPQLIRWIVDRGLANRDLAFVGQAVLGLLGLGLLRGGLTFLQQRWLEVRANGADVALYDMRPASDETQGETLTVDDVTYTAQESGSATVGVESAAGRQEGVFVEYRRYAADERRRLVLERWPDGLRALSGESVAPEDLELWTKPPDVPAGG